MTPTSGGFLHRAVHHWGETGDTGDTGDRRAEFDGPRSTRYEQLARWTLRGLYRKVADDLSGLAPPSGVLLDVGTGPGLLLRETRARRPDLVLEGVDVSPDMVALAGRILASGGTAGRATVQVADVAALPHADHSVDIVVATLSMHHWPDPAGSAAQLARILRPGGQLLVYDFRFAPLGAMLDALTRQPAFDTASLTSGPVRAGRWPITPFTRIHLRTTADG